MEHIRLLLFLLANLLFFSCKEQALISEWVSSTDANPWQLMPQVCTSAETTTSALAIHIDSKNKRQQIEGFGASFNEMGWESLSKLSQSDRDFILEELFTPNMGAGFTVCRLPIGANDFSFDWYSFDEVEGDFDLRYFSTENDEHALIPFLRAALDKNPSIKLWAVPWSPPSWMKQNKHYAMHSATDGHLACEASNTFITDDLYLQTYASYFGKYIDEYKLKGIDIRMVMPQNDFNSTKIFPSCYWTPRSLARFIHFLGPEMKKRNIKLYLGTMECANVALLDSILTDSLANRFIDGIGFQLAGKDALPVVRQKYPNLAFSQTMQECRDGRNDWEGAYLLWEQMKYYLTSGVQSYNYGNISLAKEKVGRWKLGLNSLIVVDESTNTYQFTPDYYLMKHVSHYVQPGARLLQIDDDSYQDALAFVNPDKSVVVVSANPTNQFVELQLEIDGNTQQVNMQPQSFHTWMCK